MRAEWRIGRTWSDNEIREYLRRIEMLDRNFDVDPAELQSRPGWYTYGSTSVLGRGPEGEPGAPFARARRALENYEFSDARIVKGHWDEDTDLLGRSIVLEVRALRSIRYLTGVRVGAVRSESTRAETIFGFRYDTLEGHIERGTEWFVLRKDHATGTLKFRIAACWQPGDFPNWWSRLGFRMVGKYYQQKWHRHAHKYLARVVQDTLDRQRAPSLKITFDKRTLHA